MVHRWVTVTRNSARLNYSPLSYVFQLPRRQLEGNLKDDVYYLFITPHFQNNGLAASAEWNDVHVKEK